MWAAQYFKYKEPRTFLTSGGLLEPWVTALAQQSAQDGLPGQNRGKYSR